MFSRRAFAEKIAYLGGLFALQGKFVLHEKKEEPPIVAVFEVDTELVQNCCDVDMESIRKAWLDAFNGNPPCELLCVMGGKLKFLRKEDTEKLLEDKNE